MATTERRGIDWVRGTAIIISAFMANAGLLALAAVTG
jgi:hypothetical protein